MVPNRKKSITEGQLSSSACAVVIEVTPIHYCLGSVVKESNCHGGYLRKYIKKKIILHNCRFPGNQTNSLANSHSFMKYIALSQCGLHLS